MVVKGPMPCPSAQQASVKLEKIKEVVLLGLLSCLLASLHGSCSHLPERYGTRGGSRRGSSPSAQS